MSLRHTENIEHSGVIARIEGNTLFVEITQVSACSACQAKSMCGVSDKRSRILALKVENGESYKIGEEVAVVGTVTQSRRAVVLAFGLPLIILLATMLPIIACTHNEPLAAVIALGVVVLYYISLSLFKERLGREFSFKIASPKGD